MKKKGHTKIFKDCKHFKKNICKKYPWREVKELVCNTCPFFRKNKAQIKLF